MPRKKTISASTLCKMMSRTKFGTVKATSKVPNKKNRLLEEAREKDEE